MGALENDLLEQPSAPESTPPEITPPREKKRGRPTNAERAAREGKTAETIQKPKSKAKTKAALDEGTLTQQIFGLHAMGAMLSGIPLVQITMDEAALLSKSVILVMEEYDLAVTGKTAATVQLLGVAAMIYAPRVMQILAMRKAHRQSQTVEGEATREPDTTTGRGE